VVCLGIPQLWFAVFLSIDYHAAELINIEWTTKTSDANLLINDRSILVTLDSDVTDKEEWREEKAKKSGEIYDQWEAKAKELTR
jgi:hypothetical protein